jgi:hypothetical protein
MWTIALPMLRRYLLPILLGLAFVVLIASHGWAYSHGRQLERVEQEAKQLAAEQRARKVQEALADELETAKAQRRVVTRERIRYVDRVVDPVGCGDLAVPDRVLDDLPGGARARQQADRAGG